MENCGSGIVMLSYYNFCSRGVYKFKPRVRGSFSDRNGYAKINVEIQKNSLDERTRNGIVNLFDYILSECELRGKKEFCYKYIYKNIFCVTNDEIPYHGYEKRIPIVEGLKRSWAYYDVFSFLESLLEWYVATMGEKIYNLFNELFEKECVGYRFVGCKITDIIDDLEIEEVEEALNNKYSACKNSIKKALDFLYNRENPDYPNSVKESISAVEAMCNIILGVDNATLGGALKHLEDSGVEIHGSMKKAFASLYGYTSDQSGIRHNTGIDDKTTFAEAKYMLVSCSAFVNYLLQVHEDINK